MPLTNDERGQLRLIAGVLIVAAVVGFGWVFSLPDKTECAARGHVVDPTERHCEDPRGGFQQLEEHALFHSRDVVLGVGVLLAIGYGVTRYVRRRRSRTPTA